MFYGSIKWPFWKTPPTSLRRNAEAVLNYFIFKIIFLDESACVSSSDSRRMFSVCQTSKVVQNNNKKKSTTYCSKTGYCDHNTKELLVLFCQVGAGDSGKSITLRLWNLLEKKKLVELYELQLYSNRDDVPRHHVVGNRELFQPHQ